ncbi:MAG: efflux RND transporter periplasmic adaptor subunit [Pseudomonadota bacterium]
MSALQEVRTTPEDGTMSRPPDMGEPKRKRPVVGVLQIGLVLLFFAVVVFLSRSPSGDVATGPAAGAGSGAKPAQLVRTVSPSVMTHRLKVETTGAVAVRSYVALTTQVTGRVEYTSPALRSGGAFGAGEVLVGIEKKDFELALAQADAEVASAEANLMLRQAESDAAISNYGLLNPGKVVPPLVAKTPQIEQAKAQLAAAKARQAIARTDLERTSFSLPFAGRVVENSAEVGQMVTRAQPFGRVFALDAVEVAVSIAPGELENMAPVPGRTAIVHSGDTSVPAVVSRVSAELDDRSRFARLFLDIEDKQQFAPGTFVSVTIAGPDLPDTLLLPEPARQVGGTAWVVRDGKLQAQPLRVHGSTRDGLVVEAFEVGEGVVLGAVPGAFEGLAVRVAQ